MPITSSSTFDAVVLWCNCREGYFGKHWVQTGRSAAADGLDTSVIRLPLVLNPTNAEIAEVISRVKAGTVKAYYYDGDEDVFAAVESAPQEFWQFHGRHPFWTDDGYKMMDRITTQGDLKESTNSRHFEFNGGFVPQRLPAASVNIQHELGEWSISRVNDDRFAFRLVVPSSELLQPADLATYADTQAFIRWLDSYRTEGDAILANFAVASGAFTGRRWRLPVNPDDLSVRPLVFAFASLTLGRTPLSPQNVVTVTIMLDVVAADSGFSGAALDVNNLARVVNAGSGTIPGAGQMIEPPFGSSDVGLDARRLVSNDGTLSMSGGLLLAQWKDPGSQIQRVMPLVGFGRSLDYVDLDNRFLGGKYIPRPEERPRVDLIHYNGTSTGSLWLEEAPRSVGYAGTDRTVQIQNRSTAASLELGIEPGNRPQALMTLRPGERVGIRAALNLDGTEEFVVLDPPPRYLVRGGAEMTITSPDYSHTIGTTTFGFRSWFPGDGHIQRRDVDEFTFGADPIHTSGDSLTTAFANTNHVVTVRHHGDIIVYEQVEAELRSAGTIKAAHSSVLVRQRGSTITVFGRFWNPDLTGIGTHRGYTTAFIDECQAGDRYLTGILYPTTGTTIDFSNVRLNQISQIIRVTPRIVV